MTKRRNDPFEPSPASLFPHDLATNHGQHALRFQNFRFRDLHDVGGPCNHGPDEIFRDFLFPLTGNQKEAEICVVLNNPPVYANVTVGAKAAAACAD